MNIKQIFETFSSIFQILSGIVMFPVRVLFMPFEWLMNFVRTPGAHSGRDVSIHEDGLFKSAGQWLTIAVRWLFAPVLYILRLPLVAVRNLSTAKGRDLLYAAPALGVLCFLGFVFFQVSSGDVSITDRYRQGGYAAVRAQNLPLAKTYFTRMRNDGDLSLADELSWAMILVKTGDIKESQRVLARLAPEEGPPGFAPAHRVIAISLAKNISTIQDPKILRRLKRHLDHCSDSSSTINRVWAAYYNAINNSEAALRKMVLVAEEEPKFWLTVADGYRIKNDIQRCNKILARAEAEYKKLIEEDPFDGDIRIFLAKVFVQLDRRDEAKRLLLEGLRVEPDERMKRSVASFYVMEYDLEAKQPGNFGRKFELLQTAIRIDRTYAEPYDRMTNMFIVEKAPEQRAEIKKSLLNIVTENTTSALPHFVLSNLFQTEKDQEKSNWHLERAYEIDPSSVSIINNLAWSLAHQEEPDFDRALSLANTVLEKAPSIPEFLDTHGTILLLRKDYQAAIESFEKALPRSREKFRIHQKLATCYRAIDRLDLAKVHEEKAELGMPQ